MEIIPKGQEPVNVKKRIETLFSKLNEAYPNKIIVSLDNEHKKWAETAREISRQLGYANKNDFLIAYGYQIERSEKIGGRPSSDHMAIIDELKKRYPNGSPFTKFDELKDANPDLTPKFKTLSNRAAELFGMTFTKYLISEGILTEVPKKEKISLSAEEKAEQRIDKYKRQVDEVIAELKKRYPDSSTAPGILDQLKLENTDLPIHNLTKWIQIAFEEKAIVYLERNGIINPQNKHHDIISRKIAQTQDKKAYSEFVQMASECDGSNNQLAEFVIEKEKLVKYTGTNSIVVLPSGLKSIERAAFYGNDAITEITVSEGVKLIDKGAFERCSNLKRVNLPKTLTRISDRAFESCVSLEAIVIPDSVVDLGKAAFHDCKQLKDVALSKNLKICGEQVFWGCASLERIELCCDITYVPYMAFADCKLLKIVCLNDKISKIEGGAFEGCVSLSEINLPDNLRYLWYRAFADCVSLEKVRLPSKIKRLECATFFNCKSLKEVELSENLTKIEDSCFEECTSLSKIVMYDALKTIGECAFKDCVSLTAQSFVVINREGRFCVGV